jgi:hypothetical protein
MAGEVFVDEGYSRRSAVDEGMGGYGFVTEGEIAQDNQMLSFHSYIGQTRQTKDRRGERRRRKLALSAANSSAIMRLLA